MLGLRATALSFALMTGTAAVSLPLTAEAQVFVGIRVQVAPPPLPVYEQPPLPGPDYLWTPGYWAWNGVAGDYYWVPGTWVLAPRPGLLWTPGWWGWSEGVYLFHGGYWGPHIGYYGGVNYGFGYTGFGFEGGYWSGAHYFYNRSVNNVTNVNVTNVYNKEVVVNRTTIRNVSYSGGPGGVVARPTAAQMAAEHESHVPPTPIQMQHVRAAQSNRFLLASANHGAPPVAATARPAELSGGGVVRAGRAPRPAANPGERGDYAETPRNPGAADSVRTREASPRAERDAKAPPRVEREAKAPKEPKPEKPAKPAFHEDRRPEK